MSGRPHKLWYMCKYTPLELAAGFGAQTERLEAVMDSFETADALAHPNVCGYGKALLEACMRPEVEEVVLVNCCDVARRVYDILRERRKLNFLYLLDLPHRRGRAEQWMFAHMLERFVRSYEAYSGIPFDPEAARQAAAPEQISETIHQPAASEQMSEAARRADGPEQMTAAAAGETAQRCISLQGAHGGPHLRALVESHFAIPVRDDTCSGGRAVEPVTAAADEAEFLHIYARQLLNQTPCMRMHDVAERSGIGHDAAGIVYHTMKFCDYYGFEYAKRSGRQDIPHLKIETDATRQSEGQLATRLDAFAERLQAGTVHRRDRQRMKDRQYVAGIDSGSSSTDVVIMNREKELVAWSILRTGAGAAQGAERALAEAMEQAGCTREDIAEIVATGYGRETIGLGDDAVTEITCHAWGAHYLNPDVRTIIDIGGQDSKVIRIDADGAVQNFTMNDKCAAGTGRFLEMMARTLELSMEELETRGRDWKNDVTISSMCTVFAESEVVSLIAQNTETADIIHGLNKAVAAKTAALVRRVGGEEGYMMTGGVARNAGLVEELERRLGVPICVSEHAQLCGAIGAALIALE